MLVAVETMNQGFDATVNSSSISSTTRQVRQAKQEARPSQPSGVSSTVV